MRWYLQQKQVVVPKTEVSHVLPLHMIKDPLTWMQSTVKQMYMARMVDSKTRRVKRWKDTTLYPVNDTETFIIYASTKDFLVPKRPGPSIPRRITRSYESFAHLWNDWNRAHIDVSYPTLVIR